MPAAAKSPLGRDSAWLRGVVIQNCPRMTFLPIVARELRVAARRRAPYWTRFAAALAAVGLCGWVAGITSARPQQAGDAVFQVLALLIFLYTCVAGVSATCDCLSEEKREGTLGLLFLTDLKGHDVALGKLAATSVNAIYGLLAVIPALTIPLLMGGVDSNAVWRVALVALNLLFFFLTLGLFASALCRQDNTALLVAMGIGLFLLLGAPLVYWVRAFRGHGTGAPSWLAASPATGCFAAFADFSTSSARLLFWLTALVTQAYGLIFLVWSCLIIPRSWQDRSVVSRTRRERQMGRLVRRRRLREALLAVNPYLWRCSRQRFKRGWVWTGLVLSLGGWLWIKRLFHDEDSDPIAVLLLLATLGFVLKAWVALESPRAFFEDRRGGGLELLLSTPLSGEAIVQGQRLALWRQFALPIAAVLAAHLWVMVNPAQIAIEDFNQSLAIYALLGVNLALDSLALSWWGAWLGLRGRRPNRAAMLSMAGILALPVLVYAIIDITYETTAMSGANFWALYACWAGLSLAADLFFMLTAQKKLRERFGELAADSALGRGGKPAT